MKTTLDLPDDLMREVKIRAVPRTKETERRDRGVDPQRDRCVEVFAPETAEAR